MDEKTDLVSINPAGAAVDEDSPAGFAVDEDSLAGDAVEEDSSAAMRSSTTSGGAGADLHLQSPASSVMHELPPDSPADVDMDDPFESLTSFSMLQALPDLPKGVVHDSLPNGLTYYICSNPNPPRRASLALTVRIGSIVEDDNERGVAHIVEHLAFNATKKFPDHSIVKFLESIGAAFGACQNAETSAEYTLYLLNVPIDKPEHLSLAIEFLSEFSSEIRISPEDVEKERGAILEEYRQNRNAEGRIFAAKWAVLFEGSKYAKRLPLGLDEVLKIVTPATVKKFYKKWYHLGHMAVIVVGDFIDTKNVVDILRTHFNQEGSPSIPVIPNYPIPPHNEPRFSCVVDKEAPSTTVSMTCKTPYSEKKVIQDFKHTQAQEMFHHVLNRRFNKVSRRTNAPFMSCSSRDEVFVRYVKMTIVSASCMESGTLDALRSMLLEVARVRLHGFSEAEISYVRDTMLSQAEQGYLERDQVDSGTLRDKYIQHFLDKEPVIDAKQKIQLKRTILPCISSSEVSKFAEDICTTSSCVIQTVEPHSYAKLEDLKEVILGVRTLEETGNIEPWEDEVCEEHYIDEPDSGSIETRTDFTEINTTELFLSNGMRVCIKSTNYVDKVSFAGFAYGGLSEVPEHDYFSFSMGSVISEEIGIFGFDKSLNENILGVSKPPVSANILPYKRIFHGTCEPCNLDGILQLVYQLFITDVIPKKKKVQIIMKMIEDEINARDREPQTALINRVRELIYGNSYHSRPIEIDDLRKVDPDRACRYFSDCFKDPSSFTVVIVGNIDEDLSLPDILRYLGGIHRPCEPVLHFRAVNSYRATLFPEAITREVLRVSMVEEHCIVKLVFPVLLKRTSMIEEQQFAELVRELLNMRLMHVLRFQFGEIYTVCVLLSLDDDKPSRIEDVRGNITVDFSCGQAISDELIELSLNEIKLLQENGPSDEDVSAIVEIKNRNHEHELLTNGYWLNRIMGCYHSLGYEDDLSVVCKDSSRTAGSNVMHVLFHEIKKNSLQISEIL